MAVPMIQAPAFVGIDLAWSDRKRTGLAIVDASGRLQNSTSVVSDADLDQWLENWGLAPVVIAVDAPLIVRNATGQRRCEWEVSRAFGRFDASCHTSNLSRPWFNPTRGSVLALRHGWNMDPDHIGSAETPAAIEVYPHPAMVSLFGLGRTIPYKAKSGRPVAFRRIEFLRLITHMENDLPALGLASSSRWSLLRSQVEEATRQVDLNRIEDEVDAVLCAHLAWLWSMDSSAMRVFGDLSGGYIVTPAPPKLSALAAAAGRGQRPAPCPLAYASGSGDGAPARS